LPKPVRYSQPDFFFHNRQCRRVSPIRPLPRTERGRDPIILADLQPIAATFDWRKQRRLWRQLLPT